MTRLSRIGQDVLAVALGLAGVVCLGWLPARGASVSITPSSLTNDFRGTLALNITGLATGASVAVEQYMDANGNGVIEPAQDALVRAFTVRDGGVPLIGGVRNLNVPGD